MSKFNDIIPIRYRLKNNRERFLRKILATRFYLGISRLKGHASLQDGRLSYLLSDFTKREKNAVPVSLNNTSLPQLNDSYSFLVLTDIHLTSQDTRSFEKITDVLIPSDAFITVTGDLTRNGSYEQINTFLSIVDDFPVPCFPVIGNHDIYFHGWRIWKELIGTTVYRIDSGNTTLLMLDSANGRFGSSQLHWLASQVDSLKENTFVFSHCNFFVNNIISFQQFAELWERHTVLHMLNNKIKAFFTGHSHKKYIHDVGSVSYVNMDDFRDNASYCRVFVSPDGIRCEYGNVQ